jgi:magnesium transporter
MPVHQKMLLQQVERLIEEADSDGLRQLLDKQRTSNVAEVVEYLDNEARRIILDVLDKRSSAEVIEKVDEATRGEIFELLEDSELNAIVEELSGDDAADLLAELPEERRDWVLAAMPGEEAARIRELMSYSEDSAGGIMDPVLISVREEATVAEAINKIRASNIEEDFFSIYVVNKAGQFLGDVRLRLLLTPPEDTRISDLIDRDTIYVSADADQEEVRNLFSKNDLIVVPVLDKKHRLVGRITADRVIEVAEQEAAEDLYAMAGTEPEELEKISILRAARIRMTWLLPCLIGTGITALVLTAFHNRFNLARIPLIYTAAVAFVPMIAAISGNAGLQTSAIVVSGLATGHLAAIKLSQVFSRELRIALVVAASCGIIGALACSLLIDSEPLAPIVRPLRIVFAFGTAMFAAIMVATTLGLLLPFVFRRIGIDPAISSGPLVTTGNDSISVAIYMVLTLLLVR